MLDVRWHRVTCRNHHLLRLITDQDFCRWDQASIWPLVPLFVRVSYNPINAPSKSSRARSWWEGTTWWLLPTICIMLPATRLRKHQTCRAWGWNYAWHWRRLLNLVSCFLSRTLPTSHHWMGLCCSVPDFNLNSWYGRVFDLCLFRGRALLVEAMRSLSRTTAAALERVQSAMNATSLPLLCFF